MNYIVITSINGITEAIKKFSTIQNSRIIVIGDKKSISYEHPNVEFLSIEDQIKLGFESVNTTPYNHYSRKNLGYLYSISRGAEHIYDTDDDTIPYEDWNVRSFNSSRVAKGDMYLNPFRLFTDKKIWPRGFHLACINNDNEYDILNEPNKIGVWQGVIDGDSDVDAIYRLTVNDHIKFNDAPDIAISKGCYAPFNTQSTLWNKDLYSLMYIPTTVDFRFTDILRGYISQRIMWEFGYKLGFHAANTYQIRNVHDYYSDFLGEISMYINVPKVIDILNSLNLSNMKMKECLLVAYSELYNNNVVKEEELLNLSNWILDINSFNQ